MSHCRESRSETGDILGRIRPKTNTTQLKNQKIKNQKSKIKKSKIKNQKIENQKITNHKSQIKNQNQKNQKSKNQKIKNQNQKSKNQKSKNQKSKNRKSKNQKSQITNQKSKTKKIKNQKSKNQKSKIQKYRELERKVFLPMYFYRNQKNTAGRLKMSHMPRRSVDSPRDWESQWPVGQLCLAVLWWKREQLIKQFPVGKRMPNHGDSRSPENSFTSSQTFATAFPVTNKFVRHWLHKTNKSSIKLLDRHEKNH